MHLDKWEIKCIDLDKYLNLLQTFWKLDWRTLISSTLKWGFPHFHPICVSWDIHFLMELDEGLLEEYLTRGAFGFSVFHKWIIWEHGLPSSSAGEEPACNVRDTGENFRIPGVGKIPWRREWQPTPIFLTGESHGQRGLVGYNPKGLKESDMTVAEHTCENIFEC